jgi:glutamyl-tRNA(Gln) amidotransferase subunit D
MANPGDQVKVITKDEKFEGVLMPNETENTVVVKLDSGYNIGIDSKKVKKIEVVKSSSHKNNIKVKVTKKKNLSNVCILHTGGTIASRVDYRTGGVVSKFTPEDLISMFPELGDIANIDSELISNMWSDDLRFTNLSKISKVIEKKIKQGVDGIIIGMGTDNLAVAAAGLSFIIEETPVPVIIVGAQRSSDRGSSDAGMNLVCAAEFISKTDFKGVAICMHENTNDDNCAILPATKTKKLHSSRRDAFKPVNDSISARVNYKSREIIFVKKNYNKEGSDLVLKPNFEEKVGILKVHINMFPEEFEFYKGWKGLIIEGTGLGHTPGHSPNSETEIHKKIFPALKKVIDSGCVVVITTNCVFGMVGMNVYDKGRDLQKLGVVSGEDMLTNTAFVKLAWLLGNYKDKEEVKKLISENLRGEINKRIEPDQFLD